MPLTQEQKFERAARSAARSNPENRVEQLRDRLSSALAHRAKQLDGRDPKPNANILKKQVWLRVFDQALSEGWAGTNHLSRRHQAENSSFRRKKKGSRQLRRNRI